jgi:hypothetical protein
VGEWEREQKETMPMPNAQCPMPNAQSPMPHSPFPIPIPFYLLILMANLLQSWGKIGIGNARSFGTVNGGCATGI